MELSVKINAAIDGFVSAMKAANSEVQKLVSSTGKPVTVNADTEQAKKALNGLQSEIKETQSELGKLGGGGALDGLKKSFAEGREQASAGGGMFGSLAGTIGQLASPVGAATAAVGLLTAGLAATFTIGKEFETGLQSVSAVTGVTGAALEDIGNRAQAAAAKYGGSASDQLGVFQTALSKIGPQLAQDADSLSSFSDSVNTLSKTDSALGAQGAVDALSGSLLQFGVNVNDTKEVAREGARFMNVLAASAGVGSASVSQVSESVAVAGGTAKNANISFEELNAALQVQASKSIVGSQAGTGLTAVINKLQAASGPAADQLKTMGTSSEKLGKILTTQGIGAAMTELRGAMEKLGSTSEKNAFLVSMFGETGLNTASALLGGGDMLAEFTTKVTGTSAATEQAAVNMATLSEQMSRGKAAIENYAISAFKVLAPIVSQVFSSITTAFGIISDTLAPIFSKLGETLGNVFTRIGSVITPILAIIGGALIANIVTTLSVVGTAINVFYTLAVKVFDSLYTAVKPAIDAIKKAFGFGDDVKSTFDPLKTFQDILTFVTEIIAKAGDYIATFGGYIIEFLVVPFRLAIAILAPILGGLIEFGKTIFGISGATQTAGGAINFIKNAFEFLGKVINGIITTVKAVTAGIAVFAETATKVVDKILHLDFAGAVNTAKEGGKKIGTTVADTMNEGLKKIDSAGAAGKLEKDMKAAIAEVKLSLNTLTLGKIFDDAKANADSAKAAAINQASGVQFAFEKLAAAQKGNEKERLAALEAFKTASGATDIATYEQAKKIADKAREDLAKKQRENLDESRRLKKVESANSIEDQEKENQKRITNQAKADKLKLDTDKFNAEKSAKIRIATEEEIQIQTLEIQKKTDAANFDIKIKEAKRQAAANKVATTQESIAAQLNIKQLEFDKLKSAYDTEQKINDIKGKALLKAFDDAQKRQADFAKAELESAKTNAEKIALVEGGGLKSVIATNEAKRRLIDLQNEYEIEQTIEKNLQVIKANEILRKAIASGDTAKIDTAGKAVLDAINIAEKTDAAVAAVKLKNQIEANKVDKENAERLALFKISLIQDDADRERAERLSAIQKTFDAELLAAAGNERLILDAHRKANAARYDSDEEYNRKTTDLATRTAGVLQDLGMGIAENLADMYGNTFDKINKEFDDYAAGIQKKLDGSNKEDNKKLEDETKSLRTQLAKREISYKDFQEKIAELRGKGGDEATGAEKANLAIGKSFQGLVKQSNASMDKVMKNLSENAKAGVNTWDSFSKNSADIFAGLSAGVLGTLGQMAAAGTLTLESAGKAAVGIALDTASNIALSQSPAILSAAMLPPPTGLGPIFGAIAGVAAIASIQALIALTKGAIGADQGVIGIDGNYSTPRSSRDTIPIWVREGESIINPEATAQNKALLKFINSTNRPASEFFSKSVVTGNGTLQLAHSNQIRTAQLVSAGSGSGGGDMGAMQNSLSNIERSLATAKIIETKSKHTSAVQLSVTENRAFRVQQEKAALKLERARR